MHRFPYHDVVRAGRRLAIATALLAPLWPGRLLAGPLDPADSGEVKVISGKVTTATDTATDVRSQADDLIVLGAAEQVELGYVTSYNKGQLRLDLERVL